MKRTTRLIGRKTIIHESIAKDRLIRVVEAVCPFCLKHHKSYGGELGSFSQHCSCGAQIGYSFSYRQSFEEE